MQAKYTVAFTLTDDESTLLANALSMLASVATIGVLETCDRAVSALYRDGVQYAQRSAAPFTITGIDAIQALENLCAVGSSEASNYEFDAATEALLNEFDMVLSPLCEDPTLGQGEGEGTLLA